MPAMVDEILDRVAWMTWDEKTRLFREMCEYVGGDEIAATLASQDAERRQRFDLMDGSIISFVHRELPFSFFVINKNDTIQSKHYRGTFYDLPGLGIIERYVRPGDTFLDIGSNVGNHAIYAAAFMPVSRVIAIEPNPPAMRLLQHNLRLSGVAAKADLRFLGIGLSDRDGFAEPSIPQDNLGGTFLLSNRGSGSIRLVRGDSLLAEEEIQFIKIDVERMEVEVLAGLEGLLHRCRPRIFIEVDDINMNAFRTFLERHEYEIVDRHKLHPDNENFMIVPRG